MVGEDLVDALKSANEKLMEHLKSATDENRTGVANVYAEFVEEWSDMDLDATLVSPPSSVSLRSIRTC